MNELTFSMVHFMHQYDSSIHYNSIPKIRKYKSVSFSQVANEPTLSAKVLKSFVNTPITLCMHLLQSYPQIINHNFPLYLGIHHVSAHFRPCSGSQHLHEIQEISHAYCIIVPFNFKFYSYTYLIICCQIIKDVLTSLLHSTGFIS